ADHAEADARRRYRVDALYTGYAHVLEVVPYLRRAGDAEEEVLLARGMVRHDGRGEDRIISIVDGLHVDDGRRSPGAAVVALELAEASLLLQVRGAGHALYD